MKRITVPIFAALAIGLPLTLIAGAGLFWSVYNCESSCDRGAITATVEAAPEDKSPCGSMAAAPEEAAEEEPPCPMAAKQKAAEEEPPCPSMMDQRDIEEAAEVDIDEMPCHKKAKAAQAKAEAEAEEAPVDL